MTIPLACAQMASTPFTVGANLDKADGLVRTAVRQGARVVLLPELFNTGYTYDRRLQDCAEPIGGRTTTWMQRRSRQFGVWIAAAIAEQAGAHVFDTLVLTGPAGEVHTYRKQFPAFFEMLYFRRGEELGVFDTAIGRVGVLICWDMVQTRLRRALKGNIDLLLICSAWPDLRGGNIPLYGVRQWMSTQPSVRPQQLARRLRVPVAYCNMTGHFSTRVPGVGLTYRTAFAGCSSITDGGRTVMLAAEEQVLLADVAAAPQHRRRAA